MVIYLVLGIGKGSCLLGQNKSVSQRGVICCFIFHEMVVWVGINDHGPGVEKGNSIVCVFLRLSKSSGSLSRRGNYFLFVNWCVVFYLRDRHNFLLLLLLSLQRG